MNMRQIDFRFGITDRRIPDFIKCSFLDAHSAYSRYLRSRSWETVESFQFQIAALLVFEYNMT